MLEVLHLLTQPLGLGLAGVVGGVLVTDVFILSVTRYNLRKLASDDALKREMIERGLSPEAITRVVGAGDPLLTPASDSQLTELSSALVVSTFAPATVEEVVAAFRRLDSEARAVVHSAVTGNDAEDLNEGAVAALIRGLLTSPVTAPSPVPAAKLPGEEAIVDRLFAPGTAEVSVELERR
jgi:hypothetical protein